MEILTVKSLIVPYFALLSYSYIPHIIIKFAMKLVWYRFFVFQSWCSMSVHFDASYGRHVDSGYLLCQGGHGLGTIHVRCVQQFAGIACLLCVHIDSSWVYVICNMYMYSNCKNYIIKPRKKYRFCQLASYFLQCEIMHCLHKIPFTVLS